jgi:hypothetical protein
VARSIGVILKEKVIQLGHRKGFHVTSHGSKLCCTRCAEPPSAKNERQKKIASGVVPTENQRTYRSSTRCDCPFQICFSPTQWKDKTQNKVIKITSSSVYKHDNGCLPSRAQLVVEKRKSGSYTKSVNEVKIKTILVVLGTNMTVPTGLLRELIRPLFPHGHSLDYQLLFNFRLRAQGVLESKGVEVDEMLVSQDEVRAKSLFTAMAKIIRA